MNIFKNITFILVSLGFGFNMYPQISGHQDWQKLPKKCQSCHVGHGVSNTAMLPVAEEDFCFQCHGDNNEFDRAVQGKMILPNLKMKNMRKEFRKPYHHPVEIKSAGTVVDFSRDHNVYGMTRSECLDCHRGHGVTRTGHTQGVSQKYSSKSDKELEYQLCYKCHAVIIQSSLARKNIKEWFETVNPSFHPIEAAGKNRGVPSLKKPYSVSGVINCTDCHNNDDSYGPKGPHGSEYAHLLEKNYTRDDNVSESLFQYQLCYKCHERQSILKDQSFPLHNLHVVLNNTSCFTCHHSHGSQRNSHLIKFGETQDPIRVQKSSSGRLEFLDLGDKTGQCFLTCHGVDHNPKSYQNIQ